jgi:hypothetical protein
MRKGVRRKGRGGAETTLRKPRSKPQAPHPTSPGPRVEGEPKAAPPADARDAISDFVRSLLDPSNPFARLYAVFLRQWFEPQRLFLESLQKALGERSLNEAAEDHLRHMTKAMMAAYLDVTKSVPLHRERLAGIRSNGIQTYLEAVDGLLRTLEHPRT